MTEQYMTAYCKTLALFGKYAPLEFIKVSLLLLHFAVFHFRRRSAAVCCHLLLSPTSTVNAASSAVSAGVSPNFLVVLKVFPWRSQMWVNVCRVFVVYHFCQHPPCRMLTFAAVCCHLSLSPMSTLTAASSELYAGVSPNVHVILKILPWRSQMWVYFCRVFVIYRFRQYPPPSSSGFLVQECTLMGSYLLIFQCSVISCDTT